LVARDKSLAFKLLDADARSAEKEARALRAKADRARGEARDAKNEACEGRPGGKILCLRPLNSGY